MRTVLWSSVTLFHQALLYTHLSTWYMDGCAPVQQFISSKACAKSNLGDKRIPRDKMMHFCKLNSQPTAPLHSLSMRRSHLEPDKLYLFSYSSHMAVHLFFFFNMVIYYNFNSLVLKTLFHVKCWGSFKIGDTGKKIEGYFIKYIKLLYLFDFKKL